MNIVEKIARMVDREGAYSEWQDATGKIVPPSIHQEYFQALYESLAVDLLKLFLTLNAKEVREELVEFEKNGWRKLGVPIDDPRIKKQADELIAAKFS
jgi:hypothetical protein